jgi:hypothetical protein
MVPLANVPGGSLAGQIGIAESRFGFLAQLLNGGLLLQYEDGKVILFRRNTAAKEVVEGLSVD